MTTINSSTTAMSYLNAAYGGATASSAAATNSAKADTASSPASTSSSGATVVTLSAAAQAALSAQSNVTDFATVVADTRAALDALYKEAGVTGPLDAEGEQTIYFNTLDRRALYAIATNGGQTFSVDEQNLAKKELQARFDEMLKPQAAVARITGDWSRTYQAAIDYLQEAGPEEKASAAWAGQLQALQKGYDTSVAQDGALPKGIAGDPVADYLARTEDGTATGNSRNFNSVADDVRVALDAQIKAASDKGKELVFDLSRRTGQMVDFSSFDNRALSAISLNSGDQFAVDEVRGAKKELDVRTRTNLLNALSQGNDPRNFSIGLIQQYESMSPEERQAMNWTSDFRDMAVKNYESSSSLLSMFQQATGGSSIMNYF
jgi:hypothetical protein